MRKRVFVVLCVLICALPISLSILSKYTGKNYDVELFGFAPTANKPSFSFDTFFTGDFQEQYTDWLDDNMKLGGVMTRTHATILYNFFNMGNRPIGKNKDIFEYKYIDFEYCLNGYPDYSDNLNQAKMQEYVSNLQCLNKMLKDKGIALYVLITPSKAYFDSYNLPDCYRNASIKNSINGVTCFSELIKKTDVPYLICRDMEEELKYPAFNTTGLHWARTFEQKASVKVINDLKRITGKDYRGIQLAEVKASSEPFWRDGDVFNLLNVWNKNKGNTYYEFDEKPEENDDYDSLRFIIQGTSFGEGIGHDIQKLYPYENIFYMNREGMILDYMNGGRRDYFNSWSEFDIGCYLDAVDAVILETTEPEMIDYSWGIVEYLINYLPTYERHAYIGNYVASVNCTLDDAWNSDSLHGYNKRTEGGFCWIKPYSKCILHSEEIAQKGLRMDIDIPFELFVTDCDPVNVQILVNGREVLNKDYKSDMSVHGEFLPEQFSDKYEGTFEIEIYCSKASDSGNALKVFYIGERR